VSAISGWQVLRKVSLVSSGQGVPPFWLCQKGGTSEKQRGVKDATLGRPNVFSKACQSEKNKI